MRWKLPDASSKPIGAAARWSWKRLLRTCRFVAAWNWFVVAVAGVSEFHVHSVVGHGVAPANACDCVYSQSGAPGAPALAGIWTRAPPASLPGTGSWSRGSVYVRAYWPQRRVPPSLSSYHAGGIVICVGTVVWSGSRGK